MRLVTRIAIDDNFVVNPFCAGVLEIGLLADELDDARVGTQHLGIGDTARQNQRVVFVSPDPVDGAVDGDLSPSL